MDPAEVRRTNFVQEADWPYTSPTGLAYDSGSYVPTLDKALQLAGYEEMRSRQRAHNGSNPSVAVSAEGASLAVAWYDSVNQNLEVATSPKGGLAVAYSPPPISAPAPAAVGSGQPGPCSPSGTALSISAKNIAFDKSCLAAPASTPFTIAFDNQDTPGTPHNVEIYTDSSAATRLGGATGVADTVTAPGQKTYSVGALKPGTYYFQCDVHTTMNGTFVVAK